MCNIDKQKHRNLIDKTVEAELERFLKNKDEKQVIEVFKSLDAKFIDSKADLSAVFYIYPYYPVTISIWFLYYYLN